MAFYPQVGKQLLITGVTYQIAEHPAAPGLPYGQEGRQAIVYQLLAEDQEKQALKVFKGRYRLPALVSLADKLDRFADLPGLSVCRRTVLSARRHGDLLRQHPDLTYAVLMPWIAGPTWLEVLLEKRNLSPEQSLALARSLAEVLAAMEEQGLAHCDLSGPNLLLPGLEGVTDFLVALVDVEQLYGPGLERPELLPGGSPGYAHKRAPEGLWSANADRFGGAVLLAEMLGWCDERVREASWGENYFDPPEMQQDCDRYRTLAGVLRERWGDEAARLFNWAWHSEVLADCVTFGEWLVTLPREVPVVISSSVPGKGEMKAAREASKVAVRALMDVARRLEERGNLEGALENYRQAQALAPPASELAKELGSILENLEAGQETPAVHTTPPDLMDEEEAEIAAPISQSPEEGRDREAEAALVSPLPVADTTDRNTLFDDGLAAYQRGEWAEAKELLAEVVRQQPDYERDGCKASDLLEGAISALQLPGEGLGEIAGPSLPTTEETDLDALFRDGLAAYRREEWAKARELLAEVVRQQPDYERDGHRASDLLADAGKRPAQSRGKTATKILSGALGIGAGLTLPQVAWVVITSYLLTSSTSSRGYVYSSDIKPGQIWLLCHALWFAGGAVGGAVLGRVFFNWRKSLVVALSSGVGFGLGYTLWYYAVLPLVSRLEVAWSEPVVAMMCIGLVGALSLRVANGWRKTVTPILFSMASFSVASLVLVGLQSLLIAALSQVGLVLSFVLSFTVAGVGIGAGLALDRPVGKKGRLGLLALVLAAVVLLGLMWNGDEFSASSLQPSWQVLREAGYKWSLKSRPGYLHIMTQEGDLYEDSNDARNIFLRRNPSNHNFDLQTRLTMHPSQNYEQAGVIAYEGIDDYARLTYAYIYGHRFEFGREVNARFRFHQIDAPAGERFYLRLLRRGGNYYGFYSVDGITWAPIGNHDRVNISVRWVGLVAFQGSASASFDYFYHRSLP